MLNKMALGVVAISVVFLCGMQGVLRAGEDGGRSGAPPVFPGKSCEGAQTLVTSAEKADEATRRMVSETYGKQPLYFIRNYGQKDERVRFYEQGNGHAMFFTERGVYLSLKAGEDAGSQGQEGGMAGGILVGNQKPSIPHSHSAFRNPQSAIDNPQPIIRDPQSEVVSLFPLGANKRPEIVAEGLQECKVNYLIGNDPEKWKTNIPTYKAVVYRDVYKDIDMRFYGNNRQLEYDIIVKPGASPSRVQFLYEGAEDVRINDNGDMEIVLNSAQLVRGAQDGSAANRDSNSGICGSRSEGVKLIQKKPYVYQDIDGKRVEVEGKFRVLSSGFGVKNQKSGNRNSKLAVRNPKSEIKNRKFIYGFQVASYDKCYPLVMDPPLTYSTFLGGSNSDAGNGIAVDTSGNAYITGWTRSTNFPTASAYDATLNGYGDAFVTRLNASGKALVYSTFLGGSSQDFGKGIAVDTSGNAYITGNTYSSDFPTASAYDATHNGAYDVFVTRLNASGNALVYSTFLGGSDYDFGNGIAVHTSGNAHITGDTKSSDFPTASAHDATYNGNWDVFVTRLNASGNVLVSSTFLGGYNNDIGKGIAVHTMGNTYITGQTYSPNFPTASAYDATYNGYADAFVTKINSEPIVVTKLAINVAPGSAILHGSVNPNGLPTMAWFEYDIKPDTYRSKTAEWDVGSGAKNVAMKKKIDNLSSDTKYYYRAAARNSGGTVYGRTKSFGTL